MIEAPALEYRAPSGETIQDAAVRAAYMASKEWRPVRLVVDGVELHVGPSNVQTVIAAYNRARGGQ